jgi:Spy/CpxP family protein refolding chaperone
LQFHIIILYPMLHVPRSLVVTFSVDLAIIISESVILQMICYTIEYQEGKMKFNKALVWVLFLTIFFAGAVVVEAGHFGRHQGAPGMMGPEFYGLKTMIQLKLTPEQQSQILGIIEKYDTQRKSLKVSLREARRDLARVLQAEQPDENEIKNALRQAAPIREELLVMRMKMNAELKSVLTPEQLQLLEERKAHRFEGRKARIGPVPEDTSN